MVNIDCKSRRGTKISVMILGGALCTVMMAYFVFGDTNDERGLRNLRMISIVSMTYEMIFIVLLLKEKVRVKLMARARK